LANDGAMWSVGWAGDFDLQKELKELARQARKQGTPRPLQLTGPIWSFYRFGQSLTALPDGRFITIAGEHEDFYDPDFCIYNDVIVHDGVGNCVFYTYPRDAFQPTDFHSATLAGGSIFIIGNLGYPEDRKAGYTPVFKLDLSSMRFEQIETSGDMPGWIYRHTAVLAEENEIRISGGAVWTNDGGKNTHSDNNNVFVLPLDTLTWRRV